MKVIYSINEVMGAARYLANNHPSVKKDVQEWHDKIIDHIERLANEPCDMTGTAGYVINYYDECEEYVVAQVSVSASLGDDVVFGEIDV